MRTLFVFLFGLASWSALAQTYYPFIKTGVYRDEFGAPEMHFCTYAYGDRYWFRGDTIINGQVYQILLYNEIHSDPTAPDFCPPYTVDTSTGTLYAFMRENVLEKQVFQIDTTTNTEFLLFDFSAQVGDSVTVGHPAQTVYIQNEWQETWADGSSRRILVVELEQGQTFWVESLGAWNSLWDPVAVMCICPHGFCYEEDGQHLYGSVCAETVSAKEPETGASGMILHPNPASEMLRINTRQDRPFDHVAIFNLAGQSVATQFFPATYSLDMPVHRWPTGNYVVFLWQNGQCLGRQIFHKQ